MVLNAESKYPSRRAYVLKLRGDATPRALAGRLENLVTGCQREFACADELLESIARDLEPGAGGRLADDTPREVHIATEWRRYADDFVRSVPYADTPSNRDESTPMIHPHSRRPARLSEDFERVSDRSRCCGGAGRSDRPGAHRLRHAGLPADCRSAGPVRRDLGRPRWSPRSPGGRRFHDPVLTT